MPGTRAWHFTLTDEQCAVHSVKSISAFILLACVLGGKLLAQQVFPPGVEWQRSFGGTNDDRLRILRQVNDGGFILGGFSNSDPASGNSGNKGTTPFGAYDFWIVRLDVFCAVPNRHPDQRFDCQIAAGIYASAEGFACLSKRFQVRCRTTR